MTSPDSQASPPFQSIADFRAHTLAHTELLTWCNAQAARLNPDLNALREHQPGNAATGGGPLRGVPMTVKDNIGVTGFETWAGSSAPLPETWTRSGELITRLAAAGAVVTSKSHCAEFAFGGSGYNPHHGTPKNPWDRHIHRAPGGSSSGTAVAVATGMAWFGIGTDTGGSVRVPASLCGCVGFRPSHGHWPTDGIVPLSTLFDDPGVITRNATDLSLVAAAIDRVNPLAPPALDTLRFATLPTPFLSVCEADIAANWARAKLQLEQRGVRFCNASARVVADGFEMLDEGPNTAAVSVARLIEHELPAWGMNLGPHVRRLIESHRDIEDSVVESRHARVMAFRHQIDALFAKADFLVLPTCPVGAPAVAMLSSDKYYERYSNALLRLTVLPSLFGCGALTLPMGFDSQGIPVGLQLVARPGDDQRLVACARAVESALEDFAPILDRF